MKLNQLSLSFTSDEITRALQASATSHRANDVKLPPDIADLAIKFKDGLLVISSKKKLGFMPVTLSASIAMRPSDDGEGIVLTLKKVSAGFVGSEAVASQLMKEVANALANVPGCSVSGNDVTLTKAAIATKLPWLSIPGKVTSFGIQGDTLGIAIG